MICGRRRGLTGIPESDGSAHTAGNSHKMEAAVERYLEYEKKIQPLLKANADKMAKLESMVDSIPGRLTARSPAPAVHGRRK